MSLARVVSGWFGLVVLYTVITRADKAAGVLGYVTTVTNRLGDPSLALIPRRGGSTASSSSGSSSGSSSSSSPTGTGGPTTSTYQRPLYNAGIVAPGQTLLPSSQGGLTA